MIHYYDLPYNRLDDVDDFTLDSKFARQQAKEQKENLIRKMKKQSKSNIKTQRSKDGY